ncbi:MAG: metallophosphoesterase [Proteobacteria bacterium]|nr:metallophosphoesterase [Pseudomonadota bacterium]MCP4916790.1 metallophosphoesterase [Pseudomonadota bacterium]
MGFVIFATSLWLVVHIYLAWSLIRAAGWTGRKRLAVWAGAILAALGTMIPFAVMEDSGAAWSDGIQLAGFLNMGLVSVAWFFMMFKDLAWLAARGVSKLVNGPLEDPERRQLFGRALTGGVFASAAGIVGLGFAQTKARAGIERTDVPVVGLDPALDGFTIAQISDIHVGATVQKDLVGQIVEAVNELSPDLIAVTGDLVDGSVPGLTPHVAPLGELTARHGVFFVTGNHEYYSGVHPWLDKCRELGMDVLLDEHRVVDHDGGTVIVAGVADYSAGRMEPDHISDPHAAFEGAPDGFRLLLAHQPRSYVEALAAGTQLQLSGHTHAGQYAPFTALIHLAQPFVEGLNAVSDTMWIYINRGTTWWGPPVRLGAPQEISLLTLRSV